MAEALVMYSSVADLDLGLKDAIKALDVVPRNKLTTEDYSILTSEITALRKLLQICPIYEDPAEDSYAASCTRSLVVDMLREVTQGLQQCLPILEQDRIRPRLKSAWSFKSRRDIRALLDRLRNARCQFVLALTVADGERYVT